MNSLSRNAGHEQDLIAVGATGKIGNRINRHMGDTFSFDLDEAVPLVDPSQQHVAEVNRPDPVGDLLKPDGVLLERVGEEQQPHPSLARDALSYLPTGSRRGR